MDFLAIFLFYPSELLHFNLDNNASIANFYMSVISGPVQPDKRSSKLEAGPF